LTGDDSAAENGRHEYLSRFPNRLAGVYRLLAFLVLTFLLLVSIGLAFVALIFTVIAEDNITLQLPGTFIFGLISLTWPLVAIWIFQVVNLTLGLIISQILPIGQLGRDPPLRIVINPERLTLAEGTVQHSASRTDMLWEDIAGVQEVNYQIWSRPVALISYLDPLSGGKRHRIPADTIGFQALRRDLHRRLPDTAWISSTYTLFTPRITLLAACLIIIGAIFFQVVFEFNFPIFGALSGAFICTILFFPLGAFWRLTLFLIRMRRITPAGYPPPPRHLGEVLTYFGTLVWTLLNLAFIWVLTATLISRL
jgi:hypothetical protein